MGADHEWQRGTTANLSRSGVLVYARGVGALSSQQSTNPNRPIEVVIEVSKGAVLSRIHCHATIARVIAMAPGGDLGVIAVTVGGDSLLAS